MRVPDLQRGRRWIRLVLVVGLLVAAAYVVGVKPVFIWTEVSCPPGYTEQAISIQSYFWRCVPPGGLARVVDLEALPVGSRQQWIGLYLANVKVRVFDFNIEQGTYHWLARDVPAPP